MQINIIVRDVLDAEADVLVSTANPWLNMSGGVNGAIRERCPEIQEELHQHLHSINQKAVSATTVVQTSAGALPFQHILHAVAIDPFYDSSIALVLETLRNTLTIAMQIDAKTISLPTLATGYGPLSIADFAEAFRQVLLDDWKFERITIVVRSEENVSVFEAVLFPK